MYIVLLWKPPESQNGNPNRTQAQVGLSNIEEEGEGRNTVLHSDTLLESICICVPLKWHL